MQGLLSELVTSIVEMPGKFATVALNDPLAALLLLVGAVVTTLSILVFAYLSVGAFFSLFTAASRPQPPREAH